MSGIVAYRRFLYQRSKPPTMVVRNVQRTASIASFYCNAAKVAFAFMVLLSASKLQADHATLTTVGADQLRGRVQAFPNASGLGVMSIQLDTGSTPALLFARNLGFDHFNWLSEIVGVPSYWNVSIYVENETGDYNLSPVPTPTSANPLPDPAIGTGFGEAGFHFAVAGQLADSTKPTITNSRPFYWNEQNGYPSTEYLLPDAISLFSVKFYDRPSFSVAWFTDGAKLEFRTRLVGVKAKGDAYYWEGIGTNFTWSTDAITLNGGIQTKTLNPSEPIISGGVFNVVQDLLHAGDFDSDGDVDGADFVAWQTHFPLASGATLAQGDADGDSDVDGADFVVWQTNFPFTPSAGVAPVPEPTAATLTIIGLLGIYCRRRADSR